MVCHSGDNTGPRTSATSSQHAFEAVDSQYVHCPIEKDNTGATGMTSLVIYSGQRQFVSGSWCEAASLAPNGGGVPRYSKKFLPGFNTGTDRIDFGTELNAGNTDGMFYINCWLVGNGTTGGGYISEILYSEP
jgi:hypothetical protein